ncbi:TerC family protein [bacterium]|nr:MAG: TerC family protein [bacterium]
MLDFSWVAHADAWVGLLTLAVLEVVLGIDNIVFISILSAKLPSPEEQDRARKLGLGVALISRIVLVLSAAAIVKLTAPVIHLPDFFLGLSGIKANAANAAELREEFLGVSWRDIILIVGGMFLIWKAVKEIHAKLEGEDAHHDSSVKPKLSAILMQIAILDIVFSIDSVITAVGMVEHVSIMVIAVIIAVGFMLVFSGPISKFVEEHPTVKVLALSFLILIGVSLIAEGFEKGIPKGYIYFSMAFAVIVEMINLRVRGKALHLKQNTVIKT